MTVAEYYDRQIPEQHPAMYLNGYTPQQILYAAHRKMYQDHLERQEEAEVPEFQIQSVVKIK